MVCVIQYNSHTTPHHWASCPWGELSVGRAVRGAKCPWGELSVGLNVCGTKCPWGEQSVGRAVRGASRPWGELSMGQTVHGVRCCRASCQVFVGQVVVGRVSMGRVSMGRVSMGRVVREPPPLLHEHICAFDIIFWRRKCKTGSKNNWKIL
jgi:hypothetical protein